MLSDYKAFIKWILIASAIGIIIGTIGVVFHEAVRYVSLFRESHSWLLYLMPVGGIVIVWLYRVTKSEKNSDTNFVLVSIRTEENLPIKIAPIIIISSVITHLFGGSAGQEGAALQIGSSVSSKIGELIKLDEKDIHIMTMCGMSAAFSVIFGTPITAVILSMEVISVGIMHYSALVPCAISAVIGIMVGQYAGITYLSVAITEFPKLSILSLGQIIALAMICALVSITFCYGLKRTAWIYRKFIKNKYLRVVIGSLLVIALTLLVGNNDYNGLGLSVIELSFTGKIVAWAFLLKIIFTSLTLGAGMKGGEIIPALFIGATCGNAFGSLLGLSPSLGAGIGLVAVFCGVTNCPITSLILSMELFGNTGIVFFGVATAVSYMLSGYTGLYNEQKVMYSKTKAEYIDKQVY